MATWPLIARNMFNFSSATATLHLTELDRKQVHNILYLTSVCDFWADHSTKMTTLTSDWLRHFRIPLFNSGMDLSKLLNREALYQVCIFLVHRDTLHYQSYRR